MNDIFRSNFPHDHIVLPPQIPDQGDRSWFIEQHDRGVYQLPGQLKQVTSDIG
ncbi:MAG: hypothetical protein K8R74_05940 [Bacteroidales bacterium]|nr:hypothetical protein [Bacteroidales bacterium]